LFLPVTVQRIRRVYDGDTAQFVVAGLIIANFIANVLEAELCPAQPCKVA